MARFDFSRETGRFGLMEKKESPIQKFAAFLEQFSLDSTELLQDFYDTTIEFKDPINQAGDLEELKRVFADLFKQLNDVQFTITALSENGSGGFVRWQMDYRFRRRLRTIEGVSYVTFNAHGLVTKQTDYWDASFPIYGEFPLLGAAIRYIVSVKHPKA